MDAITASQEASGNLTNITVDDSVVYIYCKVYQSACPFVGIGSPSRAIECVSPLGPKGGEQHSLACEELAGPNSEDWTESLVLGTHTLASNPTVSMGCIAWPIFLMHSSPNAANWRGLITVAENLLF
jgi:hypothetical protein